jgi:cytochrome c2
MPGDATRGAAVFRDQHCLTCHAIRGQGAEVGPDLGWIIGREYTPASMASLMWNHAPDMWSAIERKGVEEPKLSEADAADLFAYFHSIRAFEKPGDAARGKAVFSSKHCNRCHGTMMALAGGAPPVSEWRSLTDSIALAQAMWNHAGRMQARMAEVQVRWPELNSQDLADLLTYLQNLPHLRKRVGQFSLNGEDAGEKLFRNKGCVECHHGRLALETRLVPGTMSDFAVSMWNHSPKMWAYGRKTGRQPPALERDEMRQIVRYLWYATLFAEPGNPTKGRRVFIGKNCAQCHETGNAGAPDLAHVLGSRSDPLRPFSIVAVLWQHGPKMLAAMRKRRLPWPNFTRSEMTDLLAYLNAYMVNSE